MKLSSSKFEKPTNERGFFEKESSKLLRNFKKLALRFSARNAVSTFLENCVKLGKSS